MNELNPELKRLLKWAHQARSSSPEEAPFGLSSRLAGSVKPVRRPLLLLEIQEVAWGLSWVAAGLIFCGALLLLQQRSSTPATPELSSALSFLASNLPR